MHAATLPPPGPPATTLPPAQLAQAARAAQDFEAMAIGQMLAPMFETVKLSNTPFGGGAGEESWQPMLVQEMAKGIARAGGFGLARPVLDQMLRLQEAARMPDGSSPGQEAAGAARGTAR